MMISLRRFNEKGIAAFQKLIDDEKKDIDPKKAAEVDGTFIDNVKKLTLDEDLTEKLEVDIPIDNNQMFSTRKEFGELVIDLVGKHNDSFGYSNQGFWSWISAVYIDQLLEKTKDGNRYKLWAAYRYIPIDWNTLRFYRHLAFSSYWVSCLGDMPAKFFLGIPMNVHSEAIEQLLTRAKDTIAIPCVAEAAIKLYVKEHGGLKPKTIGRKTPGSAYRLATVISPQLQMNFDLHELNCDSFLELLPKEFDDWKQKSNNNNKGL